MDLKQATKLNAKHIIRKLPSINKWCKNLKPIAWGVLYALKVHTKAINQFLYGIQPDLAKVHNEYKKLAHNNPKWTDDDIKIELSGTHNTVFVDYMTTMLLCKAANKINKNKQFLNVLWADTDLNQFAWNIASIVNCKSLENQMWVHNKYNQLTCLYVIRECLKIFMTLPRNTHDIIVKHGGATEPKNIPSTILHKSFLSTDYIPSQESLWTMRNKHIIHIPGESNIPLLFIEACIHGEENEILLPPGISLKYTFKNGKNYYATASILQKYWIGLGGFSETKPNHGPYIQVDWSKNIIKDTLTDYKVPTSFDDFIQCVSKVFPSECTLEKTHITGGHKVKNVLKLIYNAI